MRYEIEEDDEYTTAKELFTRRCVAWAAERGHPADARIVAATLDSRHMSSDGRLNHWTVAAVRRAVLEWIPDTFEADPPSPELAGGSVRTVIRYQAEHGLLDPRGEALAELDAAVEVAVGEYPVAVAATSQLDESDIMALLEQLGEFTGDEPDHERRFAQLPIVLPTDSELAAQAADSALVGQMRRLTEWVGPQGRKLTARGYLRVADARELVALLDTGDDVEGVRSSADLPRLGLLVAWAREAGLVRVVSGHLRAVAKARPLLSNPVALWHRLFDTFFDLDYVLFADGGPFGWLCEDVAIDVLNTLYSLPHPMPIIRLQLPVWLSWQDQFSSVVESRTDLDVYRAGCDAALDTILETLAGLGAVELSIGVPHPDFGMDLDDAFASPFSGIEFDAKELRALRRDLRKASPLVRLTGLGAIAVRQRMLAEGREAGAVGELADADPAGLLGVVADHYTEEAARLEIQGWLARHDDDVEALLAAVHRCPFRARAAAMLRMLMIGLPQRPELLAELRTHPQLGPLAVMLMVEEGGLAHDDLAPGEADLAMTESILTLLEVGGPDEVRAQLGRIPAADRAEFAAVIRAAGHPATASVADLEVVLSDVTGGRGRHLRSV